MPSNRWAIDVRGLTSPSNVHLWMVAAFLAAFAAAATTVLTVGANERGIYDALLVTGRVSFVLFWPAYVGGAAAALFGSTFDVLKRKGRNFGLAFASAHIVHLGLVAWLCYIGSTPPIASFIVFGIAVAWVYLLAVASVRRLQKAIGRQFWWLANVIGMNYIALAFAFDFMRFPISGGFKYLVGYLPFVLLAVGGFALRAGGWMARLVWPYNATRTGA